MPSTDRRLELKEKASMAQNAWQAFVYANGLIDFEHCIVVEIWMYLYAWRNFFWTEL